MSMAENVWRLLCISFYFISDLSLYLSPRSFDPECRWLKEHLEIEVGIGIYFHFNLENILWA